jgi:predicted Zn-dependent protease
MTVSEEAQLHLAKAREFLEAAEGSRDRKLYNAATSDAIISAINSKDAICLALTGRTSKSDNHADAVPELKRAGPAGADLSPTLNRLLKLKTKSQYAPYRSPHPAPTRLWSGRSECSQVPEMSLPAAETHIKARSLILIEVTFGSLL